MVSNTTKIESLLIGIFTIIGTTLVFAFAYLVIGMFTGVIGGMCSFAPEWWENLYFRLFILIPILGVTAGVIVAFRHNKISNENSIKLK